MSLKEKLLNDMKEAMKEKDVLRKNTVQSVRGCRAAQLASIRLMSGQVSRGSAGEYQADERAGVARLSWRVSGR